MIKLEEGKRYVMRDGRLTGKVFRRYISSEPYSFSDGLYSWDHQGRFLGNGRESHLDIVAEYELNEEKSEVAAIQSERQARYGSWAGNAELTDKFFSVAQSGATFSKMTSSQRSAIFMALHKIGRICNGDPNYEDNWVDAISYLDLALKEIRKGEKANAGG